MSLDYFASQIKWFKGFSTFIFLMLVTHEYI